MLLALRRAVILLCAAAFLAACSSLNVVPATTTSPTQLNQANILAAINAARKANGGHKALAWGHNVQLEAACETQVGLMVQRDVLAHDAGMKLRARVSQAGYHGAVGEISPADSRRWSKPSRAGSTRRGIGRPCSTTNGPSSASRCSVCPRNAAAATASIGALSQAGRSRPGCRAASASGSSPRRRSSP